MLSRFSWDWSLSEVGPSLGRVYNINEETDMEVVPVRRGGSCDPILLALEGNCKVKVTGPPGCGKSSIYVASVARETGRPIVHLVPHPRLVEDFVARGYQGCTVKTQVDEVLCSPVVVKCPVVIVTTYTNFLARAMEMRKPLADVSRRPIFYCDECHESDAATYAVVRMFMSKGIYHNVIFVSATLDGETAALEPESPIVERRTALAKRSVEFQDMVVNALSSNPDARTTMVFCDQGVFNIKNTETAVINMGYSWFRLTSRTTDEQYALVKSTSRTNKVVICADSSYRSGFDIPVAMVIDTGIITYRSSRNPTRVSWRCAFGFELYQARGRLGRHALPYQCDLVYMRPDMEIRDYTVNIEGYEGIIAAHVIHAQGLDVPEELRAIGLKVSSGYLSDYRLLDSDTVITGLELLSLSEIKTRSKKKNTDNDFEFGDALQGFASLNLAKPITPTVPAVIGKTMLSVSGATRDTGVGTQTFPLGRESVLQCLNGPGLSDMLTKIGRRDMHLICGVLAEEMNTLSCEYIAADSLVKYVQQESESERSSGQVRWLREFHSALGLKVAEFKSRARDLQLLVDKAQVDFALVHPRDFKDVIATMASSCVSVYKSQKPVWLSNDVIVDNSRQRVLGNSMLNAGYDAAGRSLKVVDSVKNNRLLAESSSRPKQPVEPASSSTTVKGRAVPQFPDYSVKELTLTVAHGSLESVQRKYPNAVITPDAMRTEYDSRSQRASTSGSGSRGSWSKRTYGTGIFKHTAKSWHPPG